MSQERDLIARLYLFVVAALLTLATAYVFFKFGPGWGSGILGGLTGLAFWGCVSTSARLRSLVSALFS